MALLPPGLTCLTADPVAKPPEMPTAVAGHTLDSLTKKERNPPNKPGRLTSVALFRAAPDY